MVKKLQDKSTHSVYLYDEDGYIEFAWKTATTTKEFLKIFDKFLDLAEKNRTKGIIIDNTKMGVISEEAQQKFRTKHMPKMLGLGIKNIAMVTSQSASVQLSREIAAEEIEQKLAAAGVKYQKFSSKSEASDWMKSL